MITSCQNEVAEESSKLGVVVTILPQAAFVEQVGGEKVEVSVMVPPGASPHTYEPKPSQLVALEKAVVYFKVGSGIDFELSWMDKLLDINNEMALVDCSEGITLIESIEGEHHGGVDPHIWMSPVNTVVMVENICRGLVEADPQNRDYYEANKDTYITSLLRLNSEIKKGLEGVENRTFMVYHPSFGYYAKEYGLTMLSIEEDGKEPTPAGMASLIDRALENSIKVIFVDPQFNPQSAEVIAEAIDGTVAFIDPLVKDYLKNIELLSEALLNSME
ncbi:MAG: zinc ABC transporter substrate-binding protein [Chloroflexi bacterium]|nr:zinc ABC transporter substrate-binding protein [Chloroflexota bacterium]